MNPSLCLFYWGVNHDKGLLLIPQERVWELSFAFAGPCETCFRVLRMNRFGELRIKDAKSVGEPARQALFILYAGFQLDSSTPWIKGNPSQRPGTTCTCRERCPEAPLVAL